MRHDLGNCDCQFQAQRRSFLADLGMGFTGLALGAMLSEDGIIRAETGPAMTPALSPQFEPRAKSVG